MSIEQHDPVQLLQALIRCRSVTPAEGGALALLQRVLEPAGFTCHRMTMTEPGTADVQNFYARLGPGAPPLCFAGHGERAENPVPKLARIIDRLSTTPLDSGSEHFQASSLQATIISVPNTATNVNPGSAQANFNIRYNDLHTRGRIEAWVREHCE